MARWRESACQHRRQRRCGFDPWLGEIPWSREWQTTPVFLPGKFHRQKRPAGYSPGGCKELDMTEHAHTMDYSPPGSFWIPPESMGFPRQEHWSGLLCPPPGALSHLGIEPSSLMSPALAGGFFTTSITREAHRLHLFIPASNPSFLPFHSWQPQVCALCI